MIILPINEKVKVITVYDPFRKFNGPLYVHWNYRSHKITKVGFHHKKRIGRTIVHIYEVITETNFLRLRFDTDTLDWVLEAIGNGTEA